MLNNFRPYLYPMFYKSIDKKTSQKKKSEELFRSLNFDQNTLNNLDTNQTVMFIDHESLSIEIFLNTYKKLELFSKERLKIKMLASLYFQGEIKAMVDDLLFRIEQISIESEAYAKLPIHKNNNHEGNKLLQNIKNRVNISEKKH